MMGSGYLVQAATYTTNGDARVFLASATRPLIGNIRGIGTITQVVNLNGIRIRADVRNHNSNGTFSSTTLGIQNETTRPAGSNFHITNIFDSPQTTGSSRHGRVYAIGQSRLNFSNNWRNVPTFSSQTW